MALNDKKAIVFDWDGTLFDSMAYKCSNFVDIFERLGCDPKDLISLHTEYTGLPRNTLFSVVYRKLLKKDLSDKCFQELSNEYTELNHKKSKDAKLFDEVESTLIDLKKKYTLIISSSSVQNELDAATKNKNIAHHFQLILGSKQNFSKGPEHIKHICAEFCLSRENILFIGDDQKDIELAMQSGVDVVRIMRDEKGIKGDYLQAPHIKTIDEIYKLLGSSCI
jgi:phosphoglycolate phosphatase